MNEDVGSIETNTSNRNMNTHKKTGIFCSGHFEKYTRRCSLQKRNDRNKNLYWLTKLNILFLFERIKSKGETRWKISFTAKCERFKEN